MQREESKPRGEGVQYEALVTHVALTYFCIVGVCTHLLSRTHNIKVLQRAYAWDTVGNKDENITDRVVDGQDMSLASGHHRIMVAARGALVMMVLGKVNEFQSRPQIRVRRPRWRLSSEMFCLRIGGLVVFVKQERKRWRGTGKIPVPGR